MAPRERGATELMYLFSARGVGLDRTRLAQAPNALRARRFRFARQARYTRPARGESREMTTPAVEDSQKDPQSKMTLILSGGLDVRC